MWGWLIILGAVFLTLVKGKPLKAALGAGMLAWATLGLFATMAAFFVTYEFMISNPLGETVVVSVSPDAIAVLFGLFLGFGVVWLVGHRLFRGRL